MVSVLFFLFHVCLFFLKVSHHLITQSTKPLASERNLSSFDDNALPFSQFFFFWPIFPLLTDVTLTLLII